MRLVPLLKEVRTCRVCAEHLPLGPRPVLQVGSTASILIAGQAPGRGVHESGIPFDDASGDRRRAWLGIDRTVFYDASRIAILPMGFCYPGTGPNGDNPPRPECAPAWRQRILACLPNIELTAVLGQYAQAWHLGPAAGTVTAVVRAWRTCWPGMLPLPHPSPRNKLWTARNPWFEEEILPVLQGRVREMLG
jgi:uracil-DNA glycosylase